jgi:predicted nucleotidyltransferase component of viral defense system
VTQNPTNIAASVRQRLLDLAKERNEDFQQVITRFALERLLYRLTLSKHAERFVLKGALLFRLWFDLEQRPTRDADFLGLGSADPEDLALIFREVAGILPEHEDGMQFKPDSVKAAEIRKEAGYPGVRVTLDATLAVARIAVQCDIGFGDAVTPAPEKKLYPTLLPMPAPTLRVYPLETVVAEKLEAIVKLAAFNSRMKDFFDLWVLSQYERLDHRLLPEAVRATFKRRKTALPAEDPVGFTDEFALQKQAAWTAFIRRSGLNAPSLRDVLGTLRTAYRPILAAAREAGT